MLIPTRNLYSARNWHQSSSSRMPFVCRELETRYRTSGDGGYPDTAPPSHGRSNMCRPDYSPAQPA